MAIKVLNSKLHGGTASLNFPFKLILKLSPIEIGKAKYFYNIVKPYSRRKRQGRPFLWTFLKHVKGEELRTAGQAKCDNNNNDSV